MSNIQMQSRKELRSETHPIQAKRSKGFTLVELLVVIAIIGVIAGLAIPAIGRVMTTVRRAAMKAELTLIDSAVESYRTKYGDYPPDFVDWNLTKRHYLKIFPDIANSELNLLFRLCDLDADDTQGTNTINVARYSATAMDRAEALVWCLGGFSSDPQFPFTGTGGPLNLIDPSGSREDPANVEYNPTRSAPEMEFEPDQLSIATPNAGAAKSFTNRFQSNDDNGSNMVDVFPVYSLREGASPVVYFDARTYAFNASSTANNFNGYVRTNVEDSSSGFDAIRPVFSSVQGFVPSAGNTYGTIPVALTGWQFAKPKSFQVIAPGLDGLFGDVVDNNAGTDPVDGLPMYFQVTGTVIVPVVTATVPAELQNGTVSRFDLTGSRRIRTTQCETICRTLSMEHSRTKSNSLAVSKSTSYRPMTPILLF